MKFSVTDFKENADGSANMLLDLDAEAVEYLINYAVIRMMKDAIAEGKLYQPQKEEKDVRTDL
jgi:hypothetical protein